MICLRMLATALMMPISCQRLRKPVCSDSTRSSLGSRNWLDFEILKKKNLIFEKKNKKVQLLRNKKSLFNSFCLKFFSSSSWRRRTPCEPGSSISRTAFSIRKWRSWSTTVRKRTKAPTTRTRSNSDSMIIRFFLPFLKYAPKCVQIQYVR